MNAGEIGTEAGRIFEYNLPSYWIVRSQEDQNDHGIDAEIELKDSNGKAIGKESIFKVQIKGEEQSTYINNKKILSFNLKMDRLKYYFEFKVPVILVVVEVSTEFVYWLSITNNDELKEKVSKAKGNDSIQVHIPVENKLIRKNLELANKVITTVDDCWDYLAIQGLKASVARYPMIESDTLNERINDIGETYFKAHHQKLDNLFKDQDFENLYLEANKIATSSIVPAKDRFIAVLYYEQAFNLAPYTQIRHEEIEEQLKLCQWLLDLAREEKSSNYRFIAIGKMRRTLFKLQLDQLDATYYSIDNFRQGSLEHLIFDIEIHQLYRKCCISLQKLIDLCNRLIKTRQYRILADLFIDIAGLIMIFNIVHKARGVPETITFLDSWYHQMSVFIISYCCLAKECVQIERLYQLHAYLAQNSLGNIKEIRSAIIQQVPELRERLDEIDESVKKAEKKKDIYELSIEEQKLHFASLAKSLGMDPDDPENEFGQYVSRGLRNYDPTEIMKNCEHLFVHYRPGGIIARSLQMHSVGGIHLIVCLKHGYAKGTGNLLSLLYDNENKSESANGFKQRYCNNCSDCKSMPDGWEWNLRWYVKEVDKHKDTLSRYKF